MSSLTHRQRVIGYYHTPESLKGYKWLLKGVKHFGYYPSKTNSISMSQAMVNMQRELAQRLNLKPGDRVLDAGCGQGATSLYLARNYKFKVFGVDLLDFNIARAEASVRPDDSADFQVGDYDKTGFDPDTFDAVFTLETLVHSSDYEATLQEFRRILKPGGQLVLFEYSHKPWSELSKQAVNFYKIMDAYAVMPAFDKFDHGVLAGSLRKAGFSKVREEDITKFVLPMFKRLRQLALVPYQLVRLLRLYRQFINTHAGWGLYKYRDTVRYNIYTATKARR